MKLSKNWKRIIAGFMAVAMVFLSVDSGCISALAAEIQELNNGKYIERPTGYLALEQISVDEKVFDDEIYSYEELAEIQIYTNVETSEWHKYSNYFYYNQLSEEWKKVWDALDLVCLDFMMNGINAFEQELGGNVYYFLEAISLPENVSTDDLTIFVELFLNSNPQYYFLNNAYLVSSEETPEGMVSVAFALCLYEKFAVGTERTEATEAFQAAIEAVLSADELANATFDKDKLQYVHDYIVKNVEYNHAITTDNPETEDVNESEITDLEDKDAISQSAFSALCMNRTTVCAGYAEALQLLCNAIGIDAICVTSDDHQWNKVYINHTWYNVDPTWADARDDEQIYYDYYLRSDDAYDDKSDPQYLSHKECDFYANYLPACPIDTTPVNGYEAPGKLPEITEQTDAPEVSFMKAGINEETGEQCYMVFIQPDSPIVNVSNPAHCYYTTDGTEPSIAKAKSLRYRAPFYVEGEYTIKVKVVQSGYLDSDVVVYTNVESLPTIENVAIKSHFYQKQTFVWKALGEDVDGYIIKVYNGADSTQIGELIDVQNGNTAFYQYDTSALANGTSIYYEIYGYTEDENDEKVPVTEKVVSGKNVVNQLSMPLDVDVKWNVTTIENVDYLVIDVQEILGEDEIAQDELLLWYYSDVSVSGPDKIFTLDMSDGVTEFMYTFNEHDISYKDIGYVYITDNEKYTAFQDEAIIIGGSYVEPKLEYISDKSLDTAGQIVELEAVIKADTKMENFKYGYQWYVASDATEVGTAISGATDSIYEVKIGSFDEKYYYCKVKAEYPVEDDLIQVVTTTNDDGVHTRVVGELFGTQVTIAPIDYQIFTGSEITPEIVVTDKNTGKVLEAGVHYEVSYKNNTNVGKAEGTVMFKGDYSNAPIATVYFDIKPKSADKLSLFEVATVIYTGKAFTPTGEVKDVERNVSLEQGVDYSISYGANVNAGTAVITLKFKGNYTGTRYINFKIDPKSADNVIISNNITQTYAGFAIVPELVLKDGDKVLTVGTDYKLSCTNNTNVGTANVIITFVGNYTGEKTTTFAIVAKDASDLWIKDIPNQEYMGKGIVPELEIVYKNGNNAAVLKSEVDYTATYSDNVNLGIATITLEFKGNYTGQRTTTFNIVARNAENLTYEELENFVYTGEAFTPSITIKNGEIPLEPGKDYIVEYSDNINAGTAKATVKFDGFDGCSGNYTGTKELTFQINPKVATNCTATLVTLEDYTFNGQEIKPGVIVQDGETVLVEDTEEVKGDYTVEYIDNINAGEAKVIITFVNNYTGEATLTFQIDRKPITEADIEIEAIADQIYNGKEIVPEIVVKEKGSEVVLRPEQDYTVVAGAENIYVGTTGTVVVTIDLEGNYIYTGESIAANFNIVPRDAVNAVISPIPEQKYTGSAITPALEVKDGDIVLVVGRDYTVEYENNTNIGIEAKVIVHFTGNFTGESKTAYFTIINPVPTSITSSVFTINQGNGYISKITVGTTVNTLWSNLNEKNYVTIYDKNGSVVTGTTVLGTGMTAGITDEGRVTKRYTIIVTGDTNGDGKINITDMIAVKACTLKKSGLSGAYEKAGDVNGDGKINITDFIKVKATTLKKDTIVGVSVN